MVFITKRFSLIELLTVIAIFVALGSLLSPALKNAIKSSRNMACINKQRHIGTAIFLYSEDHEGLYPTGEDPLGTSLNVGWDDKLVDYDNRTLSDGLISWSFLPVRETPHAMHTMYNCPEDVPGQTKRGYGDGVVRRSYSLNGIRVTPATVKPPHGEYTGPWTSSVHVLVGVSYRGFSRTMQSIDDPSGTIAMADHPNYWSNLGDNGESGYLENAGASFSSWVRPRSMQNLDLNGLHESFTTNYLMCDGGVRSLFVYDTIATQSLFNRWEHASMWTTHIGD
jgi:type II secretory pathway pseudopilin PulG